MSTKNTELRVGIFVMASLIIGGGTAFIVGQQRNVFDRFVVYHAIVDDAEGLRKGSPVRVAGLTAGAVTDVDFTEQGRVQITFRISERYADRVRGRPGQIPDPTAQVPQPSRVVIGSKGMLGDKLVEVTLGNAALPAWPAARPLPTRGSGGGLMETAARVMGEAEGVARNLRSATDPLRDQQFTNDLQRVAANLATISEQVAQGEGTLGRLVRDEQFGRDTAETMANLRTASRELSTTARSIRLVADEVRSGDGSAHRLIYGPEAADAAGDIGDAASELALALRAVREGDGTLHTLIYGDEGTELLANLTEASDDLAHITGEVRAGRGTIGGLLVDPSIYEDVKRLVGDLQRNDILRALVRYSIRRDAPTTDVDVEPASDAPADDSPTSP